MLDEDDKEGRGERRLDGGDDPPVPGGVPEAKRENNNGDEFDPVWKTPKTFVRPFHNAK